MGFLKRLLGPDAGSDLSRDIFSRISRATVVLLHGVRSFAGTGGTGGTLRPRHVVSAPMAGSVWQPPTGWYPDPGGVHEWRWWDGTRWADTVSDGGVATNDELDDFNAAAQLPPGPPSPAPVPQPPTRAVEGASFGEVLRFVGWLGGVWLFVILCESAVTGGTYLGWIVVMVFIALIARKVGYRPADAWMLLIPFWNVYLLVKLMWRLACMQRPYWAAAPTF
jgi:hypothetical protein